MMDKRKNPTGPSTRLASAFRPTKAKGRKTHRRLYSRRFLARPLGVLGFSAFST